MLNRKNYTTLTEDTLFHTHTHTDTHIHTHTDTHIHTHPHIHSQNNLLYEHTRGEQNYFGIFNNWS